MQTKTKNLRFWREHKRRSRARRNALCIRKINAQKFFQTAADLRAARLRKRDRRCGGRGDAWICAAMTTRVAGWRRVYARLVELGGRLVVAARCDRERRASAIVLRVCTRRRLGFDCGGSRVAQFDWLQVDHVDERIDRPSFGGCSIVASGGGGFRYRRCCESMRKRANEAIFPGARRRRRAHHRTIAHSAAISMVAENPQSPPSSFGLRARAWLRRIDSSALAKVRRARTQISTRFTPSGVGARSQRLEPKKLT